MVAGGYSIYGYDQYYFDSFKQVCVKGYWSISNDIYLTPPNSSNSSILLIQQLSTLLKNKNIYTNYPIPSS